MIAVITGDIINSRKGSVGEWIEVLKKTLAIYGAEPKDWELFRGDSFQLSIHPEKALLAAIHIKSALRQSKKYDVRMAIGLGDEEYSSSKITESNGIAYVRSGECFEGLKKRTLGLHSGDRKLDEMFYVMFDLAMLTANHWSSTVANVITTSIENPDKNQNSLAELLGKSQSTISESLKRGGFDEIMKLNEFYKIQIPGLS